MNFQFVRQGTRYSVHTEVGNGVAHVGVLAALERELPQPQQPDQDEPADEHEETLPC